MQLDGLDFTQVRLLAALAELRNLSSAAARIGLSQSAASHALAKLRQRIGDPLFVRNAGGVHPTPYGERLGAAARLSLDALLAGLTANQPFDPRTNTRRFNIYLNDVGQMVILPRLLAHLKTEAPGTSVRVYPVPLGQPRCGARLRRDRCRGRVLHQSHGRVPSVGPPSRALRLRGAGGPSEIS